MATTRTTKTNIKDTWEDSSESEFEEEKEEEPVVLDSVAENAKDKRKVKEAFYDEENYRREEPFDTEEWDFYEGYSPCSNCGKLSVARIIMIESKRIFCYDACLEQDEIYDDDDYDDEYDHLAEHDRKLGLAVSCKKY